MADIVTFDPVNKVITPIDTLGSGDIELNIAEIYSEWKAWTVLSSSAQYFPAMRTVGGDPITDIQNLGATFFLINGWKIRPNERDHRLTLVGNLFTDPAGENVSVPTTGPYNVTVEMFVSNLVDSSVARLDLTQLLNAVYIDTLGVSGSAEGVGTPTNPSNNFTDAFTIAERDKIGEFRFNGAFCIHDLNLEGYSILGIGAEQNNILELSASNFNNVHFHNCSISGTLSGSIQAEKCKVSVTYGMDGTFRSCGIQSDFFMEDGGFLVFSDCYSEVPGNDTPKCHMGLSSAINVRNWSGGLQLNSSSAGCVASIDADPGNLILDSSNISGTITVRGFSQLTDNTGPDCIVTDTGFIHVPIFQGMSASIEDAKNNSALAVALIASK